MTEEPRPRKVRPADAARIRGQAAGPAPGMPVLREELPVTAGPHRRHWCAGCRETIEPGDPEIRVAGHGIWTGQRYYYHDRAKCRATARKAAAFQSVAAEYQTRQRKQ